MTTEFDRTAIVFPRYGIFECTVGNRKMKAACDDVALFGPIRRKTTVHAGTTGSYRSLSIIAPALSSCRHERKPRGLADGEWNLCRGEEALKPVVAFLEYMFADLSTRAPVLASTRAFAAAEVLISEHFDRLVLGQDEGDDTENAASSSKLVRRAREFMVAHHGDSISVREIAKACNVSVRTLQATFKSVTGLSPRQSLTLIRLERARLALERADSGASVADAAMGSGFFHLGRFSRLYSATYGELPSETLRSAKS